MRSNKGHENAIREAATVLVGFRQRFSSSEPGASSQSGARVIVYELDTLRHRVGRRLEQLSHAWHAACVVFDRLTTTEQCQVAEAPLGTVPDRSVLVHRRERNWCLTRLYRVRC